jgi:O-succinylbenzoate synthase
MSDLNLKTLELVEIGLPLKAPFETSFGTTHQRRILIVRIVDADGAVGYGECTAPEAPFYNHECIETAWIVIAKFIAPMIANGKVHCANEASRALAPIRGNRMAIGGVEAAVWDLEAKLAGQPLWRHLGGTRSEINSGVSIGLQSSIEVLLEKVRHEVACGYQRIKLKIKPGQDVELVKAVRNEFPEILLSVDANSAYRLERDVELLKELDKFDLLMIEQPLAAGDLVDHAKLQRKIKTRICLDESITCLADAKHAIELGACGIINIKLGRVGGHTEAKAIQEYAMQCEIPVWCGGMLESGIGRAHNIAMSTLPGFTLPGDVSASARYWHEDIIDPPVTVNSKGVITLSEDSGIGYSINEERTKSHITRREIIDLTFNVV